LVLLTHLQRLEKRKSWIAPLGIFLAILTSFVTRDFKEFWGIKAATWEALFLISGFVSLVWLIIAGYQALSAPSLNDIVSELKKSSQQKTTIN
ncbi:MAG: hypothetical protein M1305_03920, partial [Candidatus Marsarchaeota archaeon]|nr:hypothetical protein [Candidatus Marsarchaeota archaeon]